MWRIFLLFFYDKTIDMRMVLYGKTVFLKATIIANKRRYRQDFFAKSFSAW